MEQFKSIIMNIQVDKMQDMGFVSSNKKNQFCMHAIKRKVEKNK